MAAVVLLMAAAELLMLGAVVPPMAEAAEPISAVGRPMAEAVEQHTLGVVRLRTSASRRLGHPKLPPTWRNLLRTWRGLRLTSRNPLPMWEAVPRPGLTGNRS